LIAVVTVPKNTARDARDVAARDRAGDVVRDRLSTILKLLRYLLT